MNADLMQKLAANDRENARIEPKPKPYRGLTRIQIFTAKDAKIAKKKGAAFP
jgi:hypothetical protein